MAVKLLSCTIRLGGDLTHTVPKTRISEYELRLLRHIHGSEAIADLKQIGEIDLVPMEEYRLLARTYSVEKVEKCFNISLEGFGDWLEEQLINETTMREQASEFAAISLEEALSDTNVDVLGHDENVLNDDEEDEFAFDGEGNPVVAGLRPDANVEGLPNLSELIEAALPATPAKAEQTPTAATVEAVEAPAVEAAKPKASKKVTLE